MVALNDLMGSRFEVNLHNNQVDSRSNMTIVELTQLKAHSDSSIGLQYQNECISLTYDV